jgi:hypothetical protein
MEILFTPGRVTLLGEMDGNRIRRIYTDGRPHPPDPDPTFHGHSIGRWEGQTLVVDTVAVLPQSYLAIDEAVGVPTNGDLHVIERIHLAEPDVLHDDLEVIAPRNLTRPWKTTRFFYRQRARKYDIVEGVCIQGFYAERKDSQGNAVFVPIPHADGNPVGPPQTFAVVPGPNPPAPSPSRPRAPVRRRVALRRRHPGWPPDRPALRRAASATRARWCARDRQTAKRPPIAPGRATVCR